MSDTVVRLSLLRDYFQWWLDWNLSKRNAENLKTDDGTAIMCVPPHWPSHGTLKHWIETIDLAREEIKNDDAAFDNIISHKTGNHAISPYQIAQDAKARK